MSRRLSPNSGHGSDDATTPRRRVIVADDDVLLREGLVHLLARSGFEVVGQASDGGQLMDLVMELAPDLVVVDNRMPPDWANEGLEAAQWICERYPSVGVLLLSGSAEVDQVLALLCGGDHVGYLLKNQIAEVGKLADALERISRGGCVIDPSLVRELMATYHHEDPLTRLTPDERDVLAQMAQGQFDVGIADAEAGRQRRTVFTKLRLPESGTDHHRVLAILAFLDAR